MILLLATLASASILIEEPATVGEEVEITVLDDLSRPIVGAPVRVAHRVGLTGERELALGLTDARGQVYWTPTQGGRTQVRARELSTTVRVHDKTPPAPTLVLLGLTALTGLVLGLLALRPPRRRARRSPK
ncbi:MAG: hypothetical protein EA397_06310 [Deltaproteobacteria bacterium]|nr:MAG: hypothetical protein EA397_06310 [Deltaproteobacteria bacterium]